MTGYAGASASVIPDYSPNADLAAVVLGNVSLFVFALPD
jgi:hypothetical protein